MPVARCTPTSRGTKNVPLVSGISPSFAKLSTNVASSAAIVRSQANARFAPGAGGDAVHGTDHRLLEMPDAANDRIVATRDDLADVRHRAVALRQRFREILAGAEAPAGAGQQHRPHGRVGRRALQRACSAAAIARLKLFSTSGDSA